MAGAAPFHGPMPLLPKEPEIHPADLFALAEDLPWRVVHVRSRQEKVLARHLLGNDVPFYVPQIRRTTVRSGRRFTSHLPLFPGYAFVRGGAEVRDVIWRSDVAVRILDVQDQQLLHRELLQIRRLQEAGASLTPLEEFAAGDAVEIREGAFQGYIGTVVRHGRSSRLVVSVSLLHRNVAVEFDPAMLERRQAMPPP